MTQFIRRFLVLALIISLAGCSWLKKKDDPFENASAKQIYAAASESMTKENWQTAIKRLRLLEARFPYGDYAEQAQLDTAFAHYRNEQPVLAIAAADRFLRLHPTHSSADYAWYIKGLANFNEKSGLFAEISGLTDLSDRDPESALKSLDAFKQVYNRYPDSGYAADARRRAIHLTNSLARHEVQVARYYYAKRAYVAALGRSRTVIEDYQFSPAVEDALGLMLLTYREMSLPDLAADTQRILATNFPNSEYLRATRDSLLKQSQKRLFKFGRKKADDKVVSSAAGEATKEKGFFGRLWSKVRRPKN